MALVSTTTSIYETKPNAYFSYCRFSDFPDVPSLKHSLHLASMISFSLICGLILFIAPWQLIIFY